MRRAIVLAASLLLAACAGVEIKPGEKSHARRDIPPGPGLFTGKDGEFVLFRLEEEPGEAETPAPSKTEDGEDPAGEQAP